MSTVDRPLCVAMCEVIEMATRLGLQKLNELPGCWEHQIDEHWWIAVNGRKTPIKCSKGPTVEPYHCYVEFNGFPAGVFSPFDGAFAAGSVANENEFIEAMRSIPADERTKR